MNPAVRTNTGYESIRRKTRTFAVTSAQTMADEDSDVIGDTAGLGIAYNLLQASSVPPGFSMRIQRRGANALTVTRFAGDTINGVAGNVAPADDQVLQVVRVSATDWMIASAVGA